MVMQLQVKRLSLAFYTVVDCVYGLPHPASHHDRTLDIHGDPLNNEMSRQAWRSPPMQRRHYVNTSISRLSAGRSCSSVQLTRSVSSRQISTQSVHVRCNSVQLIMQDGSLWILRDICP